MNAVLCPDFRRIPVYPNTDRLCMRFTMKSNSRGTDREKLNQGDNMPARLWLARGPVSGGLRGEAQDRRRHRRQTNTRQPMAAHSIAAINPSRLFRNCVRCRQKPHPGCRVSRYLRGKRGRRPARRYFGLTLSAFTPKLRLPE